MNTNHNLSIVRLVLVLFIFVVYVVKVEANQVQPEAFYHNSNQLELLSEICTSEMNNTISENEIYITF
ncbi:hypothetical protein BHE74_00024695 [Ensete ventricosum]|nr:hypothetical protein BHE74_00024695 [Ensete ventricosum]